MPCLCPVSGPPLALGGRCKTVKLVSMKKKLGINGEVVRRERVKRAWTQEELSERSNLAVRTLRRLESGHGSLESLRRVAAALELQPEVALTPEVPFKQEISFDLVTVEVSRGLLDGGPEVFLNKLLDRVKSVRRHLARELGFLTPPVRFRDYPGESCSYRILIREQMVGQSEVHQDKELAVATHQGDQLAGLRGERVSDPTYGLPSLWIEPDQHMNWKKPRSLARLFSRCRTCSADRMPIETSASEEHLIPGKRPIPGQKALVRQRSAGWTGRSPS